MLGLCSVCVSKLDRSWLRWRQDSVASELRGRQVGVAVGTCWWFLKELVRSYDFFSRLARSGGSWDLKIDGKEVESAVNQLAGT